MLASRNAISRQTNNRGHVCLSCRRRAQLLQAQQQRRRKHVGSQALAEEEEEQEDKASTIRCLSGLPQNVINPKQGTSDGFVRLFQARDKNPPEETRPQRRRTWERRADSRRVQTIQMPLRKQGLGLRISRHSARADMIRSHLAQGDFAIKKHCPPTSYRKIVSLRTSQPPVTQEATVPEELPNLFASSVANKSEATTRHEKEVQESGVRDQQEAYEPFRLEDDGPKLDNATIQALAMLEEAANQSALAVIPRPEMRRTKSTPMQRVRPQRTASSGPYMWQRQNTSYIPVELLGHGARPAGISARLYHVSARSSQQIISESRQDVDFVQPHFLGENIADMSKPSGIRAQLRQWQELHGDEDPMPDVAYDISPVVDDDGPTNTTSEVSEEHLLQRRQAEEEIEDMPIRQGKEGYDGNVRQEMHMGDLVFIKFAQSERTGVLAVFVQQIAPNLAQYFTVQGRWLHTTAREVQYSVAGWAKREIVEPLLEHLPDKAEALNQGELKEKAYLEDLSVPREVAAPLVKLMVDFSSEVQEIYRRHARSLDDAHKILAHDIDLRYGSVASAATTLLKIPAKDLTTAHLLAVRHALSNGGFGFNFDSRSQRITGYMQIRSKEQFQLVETVRARVRQWQDDLAARASMSEKQLSRHTPSPGAQVVYDFIEKAKAIVTENRKNRDWTEFGNVGPSKVRLPIAEDLECIKIRASAEFTEEEQQLVRFMEAWSCSHMFNGLSRLEGIPPLILHATGLYQTRSPESNGGLGLFNRAVGFTFLQELGTIMPFENRTVFDQHLLLPTSQHSRPLQNLMTSLLYMQNEHGFVDSMQSLRHDWKDLPVYCIDAPDAREIDDGISIESAGAGPDLDERQWIHVHIANPTAFFSRDHPMAKMARHMGESIYMPERTYMMLPRWATQGHFSLGRNRPALTFSALVNSEGKTLEHKITSGILRNVIRLTKDETATVLDGQVPKKEEVVFAVGQRPPPKERKGKLHTLTEKNIEEIKMLRAYATKRAQLRRSGGGVFYDAGDMDVNVWANWKSPGLPWAHPYRKGSRTVEGDPVIEWRTAPMTNYFAAPENSSEVMVRECMMLACELSSAWCAERKIPIINRASEDLDTDSQAQRRHYEDVLEPHRRPDGSVPMHLGFNYVASMGKIGLSMKPGRHAMLGLDHYSKVTSPLRRYGDMITHWQIEAALRKEAETGHSLKCDPEDKKADRSWLPFSERMLETIFVGLQPREHVINRAKSYGLAHWISMLLFRKHHFNEDAPLGVLTADKISSNGGGGGGDVSELKPLRVYLHSHYGPKYMEDQLPGVCIEWNKTVNFEKNPVKLGLPAPRHGDVWECALGKVEVYSRGISVVPLRLVGREGAGMY